MSLSMPTFLSGICLQSTMTCRVEQPNAQVRIYDNFFHSDGFFKPCSDSNMFDIFQELTQLARLLWQFSIVWNSLLHQWLASYLTFLWWSFSEIESNLLHHLKVQDLTNWFHGNPHQKKRNKAWLSHLVLLWLTPFASYSVSNFHSKARWNYAKFLHFFKWNIYSFVWSHIHDSIICHSW